MEYQQPSNVPYPVNQSPQIINNPTTFSFSQSQGLSAPKLFKADGTEFYRPIPLKENVLDPKNYLKISPDIPRPSVGQQVGSGALKAIGVAGIGYGGFIDYQTGIDQGESQFRSGSNAIAGMGGAYAGGVVGGQVGATGGAAIGAIFGGAGAVPGSIIGGIGGSIVGSIAGSGVAGWASDRFLDLLGGPKSVPNPNGSSGNPFSPSDPFGAPRPSLPQPTPQSPGAPPSGGGVGGPISPDKISPDVGAPLFPLMPWLPDFKFPRMPWDPQSPQKPNDPKKPNSPSPGALKPVIPKPDKPPLLLQFGKWRFSQTFAPYVVGGPSFGSSSGTTQFGTVGSRSDQEFKVDSTYGLDGTERRYHLIRDKGSGDSGWSVFSSDLGQFSVTSRPSFVPTPTEKNTPKKPTLPNLPLGTPLPRLSPQPPSLPSPQYPPQPNLNPGISPTSPHLPGSPYMGDRQGGYIGDPVKNPSYTPPSNDGSPQPKPGIKPGSEKSPDGSPRYPGFLSPDNPTLNPAPSTNPAVNQPSVNTPKPWTNPFFAPSSGSGGSTVISPETNPGKLNTGELNTGQVNTGDLTGNTKWNPETKKYEPSFPGVSDPSTIKKPSTPYPPSVGGGSNPRTSFTLPGAAVPLIPQTPVASRIPRGAIPEPIGDTVPNSPSTPCRYMPDATEKIRVRKFTGCSVDSKGVPNYFEDIGLSVPVGSGQAWKMCLDNQADLLALQCRSSESAGGFAMPEAWAVRSGIGRPQLVIVYAEQYSSGKLGRNRWSISIPHYSRGLKSAISVPSYRRGTWSGRLALSDGSSITVNAASSAECKRAINKLKLLVPVNYRLNGVGVAYKPRIAENPDLGFKSVSVVPVFAKFYATGQRSLTPTWSKSLRK